MTLPRTTALVGLLALLLLAPPVRAGAGGRKLDRRVAHGEITRAPGADNQFTVKTEDGMEATFHADAKTRLHLRGRDDRLGELQRGTPVRVRYVVDGGRNRAVAITSDPLAGPDVRRDAARLLETLKASAYEQRDEARQKLRRVTNDLDDRIDELQARAAEATGDARAELASEVQELKAQRQKVEQRLERFGSATADAWEEVRGGIQNAVGELRSAVERAESRYEANAPGRPREE